uniref:Uncharacterized protein n=1 Tax=Candidatus Kentrum sp. TC TaxID=2126339 RepID=A0A450ZC11_9GAMM|nr:MAG: hypothetical protein BECKTC1821F_GA0114240_100150 [Candidatus Kentron sp. TC]
MVYKRLLLFLYFFMDSRTIRNTFRKLYCSFHPDANHIVDPSVETGPVRIEISKDERIRFDRSFRTPERGGRIPTHN